MPRKRPTYGECTNCGAGYLPAGATLCGPCAEATPAEHALMHAISVVVPELAISGNVPGIVEELRSAGFAIVPTTHLASVK